MKQDQRIDDIRARVKARADYTDATGVESPCDRDRADLLSIIDTLTREQRERDIAFAHFMDCYLHSTDKGKLTIEEVVDQFNASQAKDKADE